MQDGASLDASSCVRSGKGKDETQETSPYPGPSEHPWTPFVRCEKDPNDPDCDIFRNSRYQVHVRRLKAHDGGPDLIHLSFRRLDRGIVVPYRDKMRIKDELVGPECEGIELFPARSREVDTSNQFVRRVVGSDRA